MKGKSKDNIKTSNQLSFPDVNSYDHLNNCPRYTSILNRPDGDGVGIEEMDSLQMEIEALLVDAMQRTRNLKMELMILEDNVDKNEIIKINPLVNKSASCANLSANNTTDKTSNVKKLKSFAGKPTVFAKAQLKSVPAIDLPIVRNEIPDTFWQSVEPYCADITEEDIKLMEQQLEIQEKYLSMPKEIPPLGKHWTCQMAEEDMKHQIKEGSRLTDYETTIETTPAKRKALNQSIDSSGKEEHKYSIVNPLIQESFKKTSSTITTHSNHNKNHLKETVLNDSLNQGPLTQRLISALIEQNLMTSFDNGLADYLDKLGPTPTPMYMSPKTMAVNLFSFNHVGNSNNNSLEKKLKKTLIEQKILDPDENEKKNDDGCSSENETKSNIIMNDLNNAANDELAEEIRHLHNELKIVSSQCKNTLTDLLTKSKQRLIKQDYKKKISQLDDEIIEVYQKLNTSRLAKKPLTKKEKEKATWLIQERKNLVNQLKNIL